jgi:hypothetical protein
VVDAEAPAVEPAVVVVGEDCVEPVDAVDPLPAAVVVGVVVGDPAGAGSLYPPPEPDPLLAPEAEPVLPLIAIPTTKAITTAVTSCQVFQERRSFI